MYKYLIIYHKEDNDGLFSCALFYDYLISKLNINKNEIQLLPADYNFLETWSKQNDDIQQLHKEYAHILMTDISFNDPKYMKKLYDEYNSDFIWCDHHAPIIKASSEYNFDNCPGVRNTQKSAILCVYEFLYDPFNEKYSLVNNSVIPSLSTLQSVKLPKLSIITKKCINSWQNV